MATVRISEFFIVMLQCDNFDATKKLQTKENDSNFLSSASILSASTAQIEFFIGLAV